MTPEAFRKMALSLPQAVESSHMGHPDFRVGGKIFATLGYPEDGSAMLVLPPLEQQALIAKNPATFTPAAGAWGRRGSTVVVLARARAEEVRSGLAQAWRRVAAKKLAQQHLDL